MTTPVLFSRNSWFRGNLNFSGAPAFLALPILCATAFCYGRAWAAESAVGNVANILGKAELVRQDGQVVQVKKGTEIFATDQIKTKDKTAVKIQFFDGGTFTAFENASVKISEYKVTGEKENVSLKSVFDVAKGKVRFFVKPQAKGKNDATYKTSNAVMGIRGTSGFIDASLPNKTELIVLTGKVEVKNPLLPKAPAVFVNPNEMTSVSRAAAPALPKPVSAAVLSGLNAEAARVEGPSAAPSGGAGSSGPANPEKKSEPSNGSPTQGAEPKNESTNTGSNPTKVEKKAVFTPDGSVGVAVEAKASDGSQLPSIAPVMSDKNQENQRISVEQSAAKNQKLLNPDQAAASSAEKALKSVQNAKKAVQVQDELLKTKTQEAAQPSGKRNVKVKISLPSLP